MSKIRRILFGDGKKTPQYKITADDVVTSVGEILTDYRNDILRYTYTKAYIDFALENGVSKSELKKSFEKSFDTAVGWRSEEMRSIRRYIEGKKDWTREEWEKEYNKKLQELRSKPRGYWK